jgi:hypothetical protein
MDCDTPMKDGVSDVAFPELNKLLEEVFNEYTSTLTVNSEPQNAEDMDVDRPKQLTKLHVLKNILRRRHYWPYLQVKPFFDHCGLILLHNTYKRVGVEHFQKLYNESRSVVLNLEAPLGENIVLSLAHSIPDSLTTEQYKAMALPDDVCEMSYEGTMITVYYHVDKWHFGTTSCPSMDYSRYFSKDKTHGQMFDEVLQMHYEGDATNCRKLFTNQLDPSKVYTFLLVHHENGHLADHSAELGTQYKCLFHITTRDRQTLVEEDVRTNPLTNVKYVARFENQPQVLDHLSQKNIYGVIVKRTSGQLIKVSPEQLIKRDEETMGHPNHWHNMLWLYMQQNKQFMIPDYLKKYAPDLNCPKDSQGREMVPTYVIHTAMCTMRDVLLNLFYHTTTVDLTTHRYTVHKDWDGYLAPVIRFHLAQLRHIQIHKHKHSLINMRTVYHYLCHHQTVKNMRNLIHFFAMNEASLQIPPRTIECFKVLNQSLSD